MERLPPWPRGQAEGEWRGEGRAEQWYFFFSFISGPEYEMDTGAARAERHDESGPWAQIVPWA